MKALADARARDAVIREAGLSMLVEAGAGSGKTTSLADRMVGTIRSGGARVQEMAAITFTRKAAGELRGRFQTSLEKAYREEADPAARERLGEALRRMELLFTGTIHAFCARLLRERPVEARVPPGFRELEPAEDDLLRNRALDGTLASLHACGDPALAALIAAGADPGKFRDAFGVLCDYDEVAFPAPEAEPPDAKAAFQGILGFWKPWQAGLPAALPEGCSCEVLRHAQEIRDRGFPPYLPKDPVAMARLLGEFRTSRRLVQKCWSSQSAAKDAKARYDAFAEGPAAAYLRAWRAYLYALALPVLLEARRSARERRRREGTLNYQDLLLLAAELLRTNAEARGFFQRRFTRLFVDEFQDTDPVQAEVMALVASSDRKETDWTRLPIRPGALFVVGDPKQSIYRFRRADLAMFRAMRDRIAASRGRTVFLTSNFRSGKGLLSWLDRAFGGIFPAGETAEQPPHRPLEAGTEREGRVAKLTVEDGVHGAHREDAAAIARYIRAEQDAGRRGCGDFMILTPNKGHLLEYAQALEALGVPYEASGGSAFSETPEVRRLSELASCLGDPDDAVATVGILRGPLFGIRDEDLFLHHKARGSFRFAGASLAGHEPVLGALGKLGRLHALTRRLPPAAALEAILEESGLLALAASGKGAVLAGGGVFTALERARAESETGRPFPEIALALAADLDSERIEASPLEPGRAGVVRLMNLHKAKGLEAPVVFLADPIPPLSKPPRIRVSREGSRAEGFLLLENRFSDFAKETLAAPADWEAHAAAEERHLRAEADRLRYVAATRAKELLVISRYGGKAGDKVAQGAWRPFEPYLGDVPELDVPREVPAPPRHAPDLSAEARARATSAREARLEKSRLPSFIASNVTQLAGFHAAPAPPGGEPVQEGEAGKAWGVLIHGLLEALMRAKEPPSRELLERTARILAGEDLGLAALAPKAAEVARSVMGSEVWKEARASQEFHAETPFSLEFEKGTILKGVIDLAYRVAGGWAVVDWKTDVAPDPERHRAQLGLYAKAWERISGEKVVRTGLFWVRTREVTWLSGSPA